MDVLETEAEPETKWLTYAEAAHRVGRSKRNILRWRTEGMPMEWHVYDGQRCRVVDEKVLLAWWRDRMNNSPVHYYRMRAIARAEGLPEPQRRPVTRKPRTKAPLPIGGSPEAVEDETDSTAGVSAWKTFEPLDTMKPMKGRAEYDALQRELRHRVAPCRNVKDFTADRIDADTAATLAGICMKCPVLERCAAFAEAAHPPGFWAGVRI